MDGLSLSLDLFLCLFYRMWFMRPMDTECGQLSEETSAIFPFKISWGSHNLMHFAARLFPVSFRVSDKSQTPNEFVFLPYERPLFRDFHHGFLWRLMICHHVSPSWGSYLPHMFNTRQSREKQKHVRQEFRQTAKQKTKKTICRLNKNDQLVPQKI